MTPHLINMQEGNEVNERVLKIFVGYDPVESVAWHVMAHSIYSRSTSPVALIPLNLRNLEKTFKRPRDNLQSNEFSISRFLVPFLCNYYGFAAYFDCDMLIRCDVTELFNIAAASPEKAIYVVKHNYVPRNEIKYLNTKQYVYPRKNWSSMVLWNCAHQSNRRLSVEHVETAPAMHLHRFQWLNDDEIGELGPQWNWLVGEYNNPPIDLKNIHWTLGGPYFKEFADADFANDWFVERDKMIFCKQRSKD